ncbi:MAG: YraN family protein [Bacteroidota bacterium]
MKDNIGMGKTGEDLAVALLERKGYRILDRNWRWGKEELDIVAIDGTFLVIVEVKSRSSAIFADPETAVTRNKQKIMVRAANAYARYRRHPGEVRFDIITVLNGPGGEHVNHMVDAFYATL